MLRFYLLRHGQTRFNVELKVQGWNDSPLTDKGIFQARCTGYGLRNVVFDKAYSGDALRQIETARNLLSLNERPVEVIPDPHFREMRYGKYEGGTYYDMLSPLYEGLDVPYDDFNGLYPFYNDMEISDLLMARDETGTFEGPYRSFQRFREGLDDLLKNNEEGNILISTSSLVIGAFLSFQFPDFHQPHLVDNASITIVSHDGDFHLEDYNDLNFFEEGERHLSSI